jgi:hypothetical protein
MFRRGDDLDVLKPYGPQTIGDKSGGTLDIGGMIGKSADTRDPEEIFQFFKQPVFVLFNEGGGGLGHSPL